MTKRLLCACLALGLAVPASGQVADWNAIEKEAVATLQRYIRINTANPPGDVRKAADLLQTILEAEHIPTTNESGEGRSIIWAARADGTGTPAIPADAPHGRRPGRREPLDKPVRRRDCRRRDLGRGARHERAESPSLRLIALSG
jgi:hypothetical protein